LEAFFGHADVLREGPTDMSLWLTWQSVYLGANDRFGSFTSFRSSTGDVRFPPKADKSLHRSVMTLRAMSRLMHCNKFGEIQ
jgi:hypothetical protein